MANISGSDSNGKGSTLTLDFTDAVFNPRTIPPALRSAAQWVGWKSESDRKLPVNARTGKLAAVDNPATWTTFDKSQLVWAQAGVDGIGFVFKEGHFVGVDLDDCRDPGTGVIESWAQEIIEDLDSYTEISPSGTGIHIIVIGCMAGDRHKWGKVEMYSKRRYFSVTGKVVPGQEHIFARDLSDFEKRLNEQKPITAKGKDNSPSGEEWKLVCQVCEQSPSKDPDVLEDEFRRRYSTYYEKRKAEKGDRSGKNIIRYTIEKWLRKSDEPEASPVGLLEIADMPDDALDGRLGEICQRRLKRLPRAYAWPALVTAASVLVPPMRKVRTNLYAALVGATGTGKTVAGDHSCQILGLQEPRLVKTMAGSAEGLFRHIGDAGGGARLLFPDELSHLLAKAAIERASFPYVLTRGYYQTSFDLTIAKGKRIPIDCRLSVLGGIVYENFQNSFGHTTTAGLHDRFIFGLWPTKFEFAYRPLVGQAERLHLCHVEVDASVWEAVSDWKHQGMSGRVAENALRVAVICASFSGNRRLQASDLDSAFAFAQYESHICRYLQPNPGENTDARCAFATINFLKLQPQDSWLRQRDLYRAINATRFGPGAFERALRALECAGEVEITPLNKRPKLVRLAREN